MSLTNQQIVFIIYSLIDQRNDSRKYSKLKWSHEPQVRGFTATFWTFYGIISMVYSLRVKTKKKCCWFVFIITWKKYEQNWLHFSLGNVHMTERKNTPSLLLHCVFYVMFVVYTLIDHSSWPMSMWEIWQLLEF